MSVNFPSVLSALALSICATFAAAGDLRLLMIEQDGCHWCARWNEEIAPIWPKTEEGQAAPLERHDIADQSDLNLTGRVLFTPTFIITDDGAEVGRIEGYPGEDFFWPLIHKLISDHKDTGS